MIKVGKERKAIAQDGDSPHCGNGSLVEKDWMKNLESRSIGEQPILEILEVIKRHRENAYRRINQELVSMYWEIGKHLSEKVNEKKWGAKVIEATAREIKRTNPTLKGFDRAGLFRMMQFYETYKDYEIVAPLVRQISWTNNLVIFSHKSSLEEKEFYLRLCIKNNYSKRELMRQIESHYYERYLLSNGKEMETGEAVAGEEDYPNTRLLDTYSLEFLDLPNHYKEKDLKDSIVSNLKDFILEIGKDFTFIDQEHRINVGGEDFYIDLLFYNRTHSCLVAFELKVGEFKPEYVSKMDFYLAALDKFEKKKHENPSVGIILCSSKNEPVVELSTSRSLSPTAISTYTTKLIDTDLLKNKIIEYRSLFEGKNGREER